MATFDEVIKHLGQTRYLDPKHKWIKVKNENKMNVWYNELVGFIFKVVHESSTAYWVNWSDNKNAWIYKIDAEVFSTPGRDT